MSVNWPCLFRFAYSFFPALLLCVVRAIFVLLYENYIIVICPLKGIGRSGVQVNGKLAFPAG
jgi:hypothetical protein